MIKTENLAIGYNRKPLLKNINITAEKNSCVCIYGENGCGKTTLLKTLQGFIPPVSGSAVVGGYNLKDIWNIRKISASVFQNNDIDRGFPILAKEAVSLGRYRINSLKTTDKDREITEKTMKLCNVWDLKDMPYGHLSGGQQQRVNIATALVSEPKILFLDEPGTFLDTESRDLLIETINSLKQNMTLLVVSHYRYFTEAIADKVYNLEDFK